LNHSTFAVYAEATMTRTQLMQQKPIKSLSFTKGVVSKDENEA